MKRYALILFCAVAVIALPFLFRRPAETGDWRPGDPVLIIVSPHNEAIRLEFAHAFSRWHRERYGAPVQVDWRAIGGTTEIMRFLAGAYTAAYRGWRRREGLSWPPGAGPQTLDRRFRPDHPPAQADRIPEWEQHRELWQTFRRYDDPGMFAAGIDLFFGGGTFDHNVAAEQGMTVVPWTEGAEPPGLFQDEDGHSLIPERLSGEVWRTDTYFGCTVSTFGICYNPDRLRDIGITTPPVRWTDLTDPRYAGYLGVADPTKSGSIAKAFELIVHQHCAEAVAAAGFDAETVERFERTMGAAGLPRGTLPAGIPANYQQAIEEGWRRGLDCIQRIGANARYFTDAAGKVPLDVATGSAAAGIAIDFYGRFQSETSRAPDGTPRMFYFTPQAGSSVSADPISLLRGAPNRETAVRFILFVLSEDGQKLWNYRPGTPGGPRRFALRRLPIRRDFYPGDDPRIQASFETHQPHTSDPLDDPGVNPYKLALDFVYYSRWTGAHFSVHRDLIRAMCMDASVELRAAWKAILDHGGPANNPRAMQLLQRLPDRPEPMTWANAPDIIRRHPRVDYLREWVLFYRQSYAEAREAVLADGHGNPAHP